MTMPIPFDYHMHSNNSPDSRTPMREMCQTALQRGIYEIAFTEHFNFHPKDFCLGKYDPERYFKDIEQCRKEFEPQGLTIKAAAEVGEMHRFRDRVDQVLNQYPYDLILGSLHWYRDESIFERPYFQSRDHHRAAHDYFVELKEMVAAGGFNIMSHLDVFKRMGYQVYNHFDICDYEEDVRAVFEVCIQQGIAPEINTSGLRLSVAQSHPTLDAIRWYREMGGELLSIGSDAHNPSQLGTGLDKALEIAVTAGFTHLTKYANRQIETKIEITHPQYN